MSDGLIDLFDVQTVLSGVPGAPPIVSTAIEGSPSGNPSPSDLAGHGSSVRAVKQTTSPVTKPVPKALPCWKWKDDSCSLDATLLLSLRVLQEHKDKCIGVKSGEPVYV